MLNLARIDRIIATDVIYHGSNYDRLARLLHAIKSRFPACEINVLIPSDRIKGQDFLNIMNDLSFAYEAESFEDTSYYAPVLQDEKEAK